MRAPINLQLAGTDNFRSLKGLPAHDGRRIAGHTLLRSDQLHMLGAEGWETLRTLGVKTVCDLRSEGERQRTPNNLPVELEQLALEVTGDMRADKSVSSLLVESPDLAGAEAMMFEVYRRLPGMLAPHLPKLFGLFETGNVPVLVHCAAGKDRTGFAVAVILHALGVARDVIVADYQLSARRMVDASDVRRELMSTLVSNMIDKPCPDEAVDAIMDARPEYLQTAYDCVDKHYGSMDAYIETCVGLDASGLRVSGTVISPLTDARLAVRSRSFPLKHIPPDGVRGDCLRIRPWSVSPHGVGVVCKQGTAAKKSCSPPRG